MDTRLSVSAGKPSPLGVSIQDDGINIAVVSRHAERVFFCLFDERGEHELARLPLASRFGDVHHSFITGIRSGARYGLRAEGPWDPDHGHRFDPAKLLVDPYASALDRPFQWHPALAQVRASAVDTALWVPKAIVTPTPPPAPRPHARRPQFIYEVSVRAFSQRHPDIPAPQRGTVAALGHPSVIAHLHHLGVDTVELMPITAGIDERHLAPLALHNAWGYNPVSLMAPDPRLAPGGLAEVRSAVAALHAAGIQVILDVVFNHTGEGDKFGPCVSLRGLDNALYYRHAAGNPGLLVNDTGCGNTLACDQTPVLQWVMDAMRHWVNATGIDGFRFDLAPVLGRRASGFDPDAPLLAAIAQDPLLGNLCLIAEPWDVGPGGYQLGAFPAPWQEWNDRYRDDVRRFWRGDFGSVGALATRLAGSSDVFHHRHRAPSCSINFVAAHDGFTLLDVVSYRNKRNHANGENNGDGKGDEVAWAPTIEGDTHDPATLAQRRGDVRALLATLFCSRGTPMLTAGDEFGRSQRGNNNAYAQDNEITWLDWAKADPSLIDFVHALAALRAAHPALHADHFLKGKADEAILEPDAVWLRTDGAAMDNDDWSCRSLRQLGLALRHGDDRVLLYLNADTAPVALTLPPARPARAWVLALSSCGEAEPADQLPARCVRVYTEAASANGD